MDEATRRRRRPSRLGDVLPSVAASLGLEEQLRFGRQGAAWQRLVGELVPTARGGSTLLSVQPPALVVSAADGAIAQELRLHGAALLAAFADMPEGQKLIELRVVVRPQAGGQRRSRV